MNELLVRKYLKKDDIYIHADFHGAASTVIKNQYGGEVPLNTIQEVNKELLFNIYNSMMIIK